MSALENKKNYLEALDEKLTAFMTDIEKLSSDDGYSRLHELLKNVIKTEEDLRSLHRLGKKLHVIQQQLQAVLAQFEKETGILKEKKIDVNKNFRKPGPNEIIVYVLLFNMQGCILKTWERAFSKEALSDYSVNRPVYMNRDEILKVIAAKTVSAQHAALSVIVGNNDVVSSIKSKGVIKNQKGFVLLKLKEGALKKENIQEFYHEGKIYYLKDGILVVAK